MFVIKSKSILSEKEEADGVRVAVMRRVKPEHEFDIWIPVLSPSTELVDSYTKNKSISWEEFVPQFLLELDKNIFYLRFLVEMAKDTPVTLLCYEEQGDNCHRTLLLKRIKELFPSQEIQPD